MSFRRGSIPETHRAIGASSRMAVTPNAGNYLIYSFEHDAWWRPDRRGYTRNIDEAGRYSATEAGAIMQDATLGHEAAVPELLAVDIINVERARHRESVLEHADRRRRGAPGPY